MAASSRRGAPVFWWKSAWVQCTKQGAAPQKNKAMTAMRKASSTPYQCPWTSTTQRRGSTHNKSQEAACMGPEGRTSRSSSAVAVSAKAPNSIVFPPEAAPLCAQTNNKLTPCIGHTCQLMEDVEGGHGSNLATGTRSGSDTKDYWQGGSETHVCRRNMNSPISGGHEQQCEEEILCCDFCQDPRQLFISICTCCKHVNGTAKALPAGEEVLKIGLEDSCEATSTARPSRLNSELFQTKPTSCADLEAI
eukprot:CAMPEP_0180509682 /NCGR_PEP_ID=MMETSP1036_2-20121128/49859_1 /TAXON_ID=632150 /ORGANISM="Azadinium spinosum, Strain 3D9" /LENGTH=248 /DNA_ID=CAMNT_0022520119 /DNA_START=35 /DNA_END=780 /DNA_ORIENTATION=+